MSNLDQATEFIQSKISAQPKIAIVLGSGLGQLTEHLKDTQYISYQDIPGFPESNVAGHRARLGFGTLNGADVVVMDGRFHLYEGHSIQDIGFPILVLKKLGIEKLILSTASGGINPSFKPGDLMIIKDHINYMGTNPMMGANDSGLGPRFFDLSEAYSPALISKAKEAASELNLDHQEGVHCAVTGPCYETAAEIRFFTTIGADSVSMSTVPEVITANYCGIECLAIACITNMATGIAKTKHTHEEVVATANQAAERFTKWVIKTVGLL